MQAELLAAYRATRYVALEGCCVAIARIGRHSLSIDRLLGRRGFCSGIFITAWNPRSRVLGEADNLAAQRRLERDLAGTGRPWLPHLGIGEDGAWPPECGALALGLSPAQGLLLARYYEQHAIVAVAAGQPAALVLTGLDHRPAALSSRGA